jgi:hypothetical protein
MSKNRSRTLCPSSKGILLSTWRGAGTKKAPACPQARIFAGIAFSPIEKLKKHN